MESRSFELIVAVVIGLLLIAVFLWVFLPKFDIAEQQERSMVMKWLGLLEPEKDICEHLRVRAEGFLLDLDTGRLIDKITIASNFIDILQQFEDNPRCRAGRFDVQNMQEDQFNQVFKALMDSKKPEALDVCKLRFGHNSLYCQSIETMMQAW